MDRVLRAVALVSGTLTLFMAMTGALLRIVGPATTQTFNIGSPIDLSPKLSRRRSTRSSGWCSRAGCPAIPCRGSIDAIATRVANLINERQSR